MCAYWETEERLKNINLFTKFRLWAPAIKQSFFNVPFLTRLFFFSDLTFIIFHFLNLCNICVFMCNIYASKCIFVFYIVQASDNLASEP